MIADGNIDLRSDWHKGKMLTLTGSILWWDDSLQSTVKDLSKYQDVQENWIIGYASS